MRYNELDLASLKQFDFQSEIDKCEIKICSEYYKVFKRRERDFIEKENELGQKVFSFLSFITSFHLFPSNRQVSLLPSGNLKLFSDEDLKLLEELLHIVDDWDLKARIADIIWLQKKDYRMIKYAAEAYFEAAKSIKENSITKKAYRFNRAFSLVAKLGKEKPLFSKISRYLQKIIADYQGTNYDLYYSQIMMLLLDQAQGDFSLYARYTMMSAELAEENNEYHKARAYWNLSIKFHRSLNRQEKMHQCMINKAESFVKEAETTIEHSEDAKYLLASSFLKEAIKQYRIIGNYDERIKQLHEMLLEYQKKSESEFKEIRVTQQIDNEEFKKQIKNELSGKDTIEKLRILADYFQLSIPTYDDLEKMANNTLEKSISRRILPIVQVRNEGKTSKTLNHGKNDKRAVYMDEMNRLVTYHLSVYTITIMQPILNEITKSGNEIKESDLVAIVKNRLFVPENNQKLYLRGIYTGLKEDFISSVHILLPQLENSLRYLLQIDGKIVSKLDEQMIQDEYTLNHLLCKFEDDLSRILGKGLYFVLKSVLIERSGMNFRNYCLHGMLNDSIEEDWVPKWIWWVTLALCFHVSEIVENKDLNPSMKNKGDKEDET